MATRYSGACTRTRSGSASLPRVRYYEAFNEPNLPNYLAPQWVGKTPKSPELYRDLLNGFYAGVHSVNADNVVIGAGTAPFGDGPGTERMRPLQLPGVRFSASRTASG